MNIPDNPFRRKETCGGCFFGLDNHDRFAPEGERTNNLISTRRHIVDRGYIVCAMQKIGGVPDTDAREASWNSCRFNPTSYAPISEGILHRMTRHIGTAYRLADNLLTKLFPYG